MTPAEREALRAVKLSSAPRPDYVWENSETHVPEVNIEVVDAIGRRVEDALDNHDLRAQPIVGATGSGKTHALGGARRRVQEAGGFFFLYEWSNTKDFWSNLQRRLVECLQRPHELDGSQLQFFLSRLTTTIGMESDVAERIRSGSFSAVDLKQMSMQLRRMHPRLGVSVRQIASSLAMLHSADTEICDVAESYLAGTPEVELGERSQWRLPMGQLDPEEFIRGLTRLLALVGPSLMAVDQIDPLVNHSDEATGKINSTGKPKTGSALSGLGSALMDLREKMARTVLMVACQPITWGELGGKVEPAVLGRFHAKAECQELPDAEAGRLLVAAHFALHFRKVGFNPPYPTWPIAPSCFDDSDQFSPRRLLERAETHVKWCLDNKEIRELRSFFEVLEPQQDAGPVDSDTDNAVEELFAKYVAAADVSDALRKDTQDVVVPDLLRAGLEAVVEERGGAVFHIELPGKHKPGWHLKFSVEADDSESEKEVKWTIGLVAQKQWNSVQSRIGNLHSKAQLEVGNPYRHAILMRTGSWQQNKKVEARLDDFNKSGGRMLEYEDATADLKVFQAVQRLREEGPEGLDSWLQRRRPASATTVARMIFPDPESESDLTSPPDSPSGPTAATEPELLDVGTAAGPGVAAPVPGGPRVEVGHCVDTGSPVSLALDAMRKHTVIFAGSGSGKTVLLRRIVEECALHGVSAVVLDPNNDLARLGDPWPDPPVSWREGDEVRAASYLHDTEITVWTPRRQAGRPLVFQPLPNFAAVLDDQDELDQSLESAVAALAPRVRGNRDTEKADARQAVLRQTLDYFARHRPGGSLPDFIELLAELPEDVVDLDQGVELARQLSQLLRVASSNDPLFGGVGTAVDPGELLRPGPGKRAKISVISMIGLVGDEQRQSFVNQLQMALFAWIKQNPAAGSLGALLVMDEAQTFAPSGGKTGCTESTVALASQARKYGLGLVFATQAPRGIDNRIVGNASTQFYGFLNSPTQIAVARELARSKTSDVVDISRLSAGQFYAVSEGLRFQKITAPMCLSYHPPNALTTEEVLDRAKAGTA